MSSTINGLGKADLITYLKKALEGAPNDNKKELYGLLTKCFMDADTNFDGGVDHKEFDAMIDIAAATPRKHGLAPSNDQMFKNADEKLQKRTALFKTIDSNGDGVISMDEWINFAYAHIQGKLATL